jgi:crossover junction endodeoxyribonuclease RusA
MTVVEFTVPGVPAPQGSKNAFGGEANPRTRPWRAAITAEASMYYEEPLRGPVGVTADFVFPRPKSHFGTGKNAGTVKATAPFLAISKKVGDLDKLCRAVGDALTGVALLDDSQIVCWSAEKRYGPSAHLRLRIVDLSEEESC